MQPKLWPIRWKRVLRRRALQARQQRVAAALAERARAVLHLPERELAQRRKEQAADLVADAEQLRRRPRRAGVALVDDRLRVEGCPGRRPVRRRCPWLQAGLGEERGVGIEERLRRRRGVGLVRCCLQDRLDRGARARRVGDSLGPGVDVAVASSAAGLPRARRWPPAGGSSSPKGMLGQCRPTISGVNPPGRCPAAAISAACAAVAPIQRSYCAIAAGTSPCQPWLVKMTSLTGRAGSATRLISVSLRSVPSGSGFSLPLSSKMTRRS